MHDITEIILNLYQYKEGVDKNAWQKPNPPIPFDREVV